MISSPEYDTIGLLVREMEKTSDDPHTQVGCVITDTHNHVLVTGANKLTHNVEKTEERMQRPEKYDWIEHAERNAIYNAARRGIALEGTSMHLPGFPCVECARAIAQSGIAALHCGSTEGWDETRYKFTKSREILRKAGVLLFERAI